MKSGAILPAATGPPDDEGSSATFPPSFNTCPTSPVPAKFAYATTPIATTRIATAIAESIFESRSIGYARSAFGASIADRRGAVEYHIAKPITIMTKEISCASLRPIATRGLILRNSTVKRARPSNIK